MKKLELKFGSIKEMLTKEQMKKISGGDVCSVSGSSNPQFGGWQCGADACTCQDTYDEYCLNGNVSAWCSNVDCGCK